MNVEMNFKRFDKSLPTLYRESDDNAGYDLFARLDSSLTIEPGASYKIPLNVATEIPQLAVGLIFQRSSTFSKWGIKLTNNVGVVDSSYRGDGDEWKAEFRNETNRPVIIKNGDKICQAVFLSILPLKLVEKPELGNKDRGGFGTSFNNSEEQELKQDSKQSTHERPSEKSPYKTKPYWCPYCNKWTAIRRRDSYRRTTCCGISERDFEIKKANNLWR